MIKSGIHLVADMEQILPWLLAIAYVVFHWMLGGCRRCMPVQNICQFPDNSIVLKIVLDKLSMIGLVVWSVVIKENFVYVR